jgi:hypothetical protein
MRSQPFSASPAVPLVEVLHAVFHRALVGADLVVAALVQRLAACVHALRDLVVLDAGLHVGRALRLHETGLEGGDLLGVVELHHVERLVDTERVQGRDGQHVRVPLHHDVRVVGQPHRALCRQLAVAVLHQHLMPLLVGGAARLEQVLDAHGLDRVLGLEFPLQVVAGHEVAQAGVEGHDVVVLQIDLDEGLPVVVAGVQLDVAQHHAFEAQRGRWTHVRQVGVDVAAVVLEQQAVPFPQRVALEVGTGVVREVRGAQQGAQLAASRLAAAVGPAVQGADDMATAVTLGVLAQVAATLEHHGLAVAADVGNEFDAVGGAHQRTSFTFLRQGEVVAQLGNRVHVPHVAGPVLKDRFKFPAEQCLVEVAGNRQLACGLLQLKTQIRHGGPDLKTPPMKGQGEALERVNDLRGMGEVLRPSGLVRPVS